MVKLENSIDDFLSKHISSNISDKDTKQIIDSGRICEDNCKNADLISHEGCEKVCKYYLKYYEDVNDKIQCPNCDYYNFMFEDCLQIYCYNCNIIYDVISGKHESFIINPIVIYRNNDLIDSIERIKFKEFMNTLSAITRRNLKNKKYVKHMDKNLVLYKIFKNQLYNVW